MSIQQQGVVSEVLQKPGEMFLATIHFVNCTSVNRGARRYYSREIWLSERVMDQDGRVCASCRAPLNRGEKVAVGTYTRYCGNCYAPMNEDDAYVHSDGPRADEVTVARLLGRKYGLASGKEFNHVEMINEERSK